MLRSPNFRDHTGLVTANSPLEDDLNEIIDRIGAGRRLPDRFYRAAIDRDHDALLDALGVMHLHLGNRGSDELLFLVQYPERVVLLEINSHKHFTTEPKGSLLSSLHQQHLERMAREAAETEIAEGAARRAAIERSVMRLRPTRQKTDE